MLPEQGPIEAGTACLCQEGGHTQVEWHITTFSLADPQQARNVASRLASRSRALLQLVVCSTLSSTAQPRPRHFLSVLEYQVTPSPPALHQCVLQTAFEVPSRPLALPLPTSTLGCNTTWVNLHQPPSPASSLELLCRNVLRPGTLVDRWAEVRHGPCNSHDRVSRVLTDWQTSRQEMLTHIHKPRIDSKLSSTQSLGILPQAPNLFDNCFSHLINYIPRKIKHTQKKDERKQRDGEAFFFIPSLGKRRHE